MTKFITASFFSLVLLVAPVAALDWRTSLNRLRPAFIGAPR